jgi:hypothetical protein
MTDAQKQPLSRTLNRWATQTALNEIEKTGKSLPGKVTAVNGAIVTISFLVDDATLPVVQMPLIGPEYIRYPIQVGDKGVAVAIDTSLALICGLGTQPATLEFLQGNLSTLFWVPIGSKNWSAVDPNALTLYAPNGVVMRDSDGNTVATLTPNGWVLSAKTMISLMVGTMGISITSAGTVIDGVGFLPHTHTSESVGDPTGPVIP